MPEDREDGPTYRVIGVSRPRADSLAKVTGTACFAADQSAPAGLLHARIVPSVYAHARIRSIDASAALAVPGVVAVLTANDFRVVAVGDGRRAVPLARDVAVFAGQPVALVVARTEAAATDGADVQVVRLFAILHDARRWNEGSDPDHGQRAADLAADLCGTMFHLDDARLTVLREACILHDRGKVSADATTGVCWDADRLDLPRVGIAPAPRLMSTAEGKRRAGNRWYP